jgi:spore maturation protein CgeB
VKILLLDTFYPAFLQSFFRDDRLADDQTYEATWRRLMDRCFGTADYYSAGLTRIGHQAKEIVVNAVPLQQRWLRERAPKLKTRGRAGDLAWEMSVVAEQVRQFGPDVVYVQDVTHFPADFVDGLRGDRGVLVGQTAYPLDWSYPFAVYDLVVTSFPHYVDRFRAGGVRSEYMSLAFAPQVRERIPETPRDVEVAFAGSFSAAHRSALPTLAACARELPIQFWGVGWDGLENADIRRRYRAEAWGIELFRILARTRIGLNRHIEVAENCANNMRLYETTGMGACLVTEARPNLSSLFVPDSEVVTYSSPADCVERISYLLSHPREAEAIALAGHERTMRDHTYDKRMPELAGTLEQVRSAPSLLRPQRFPPSHVAQKGRTASLIGRLRRVAGRGTAR